MQVSMIKNFKQYIVYISPIVALFGLLFVLNSTSPLTVGPAGILLVFTLIYVLIVSVLYALTIASTYALSRFWSVRPAQQRKLYYITSIIAFGPVFLLALHSIGQLEFKDFVLVVLLIVVTFFYVVRRIK